MKKETHVAGVVGDAIIAPDKSVTQCTVSCSEDFLCGIRLLECDFICGGQERGVHGGVVFPGVRSGIVSSLAS